ncbi:ribosome small subunit-dependent GTPase A [Xylanibacillus composti]|uniref:Small ribosomal subunit biogenesis GTPase RsgA n=1 Tax=Xylanibacillus composti TaxID=1572762 RepID=A0A8J4H3Z4_9BACL|nr:ribosome small subunit-dependent GTPase A [Xylanibacillus composti]MDT9726317.1 ribosome small subunit-dependent GTPase A [Xylanibacillus composti]GIQ70577.1 putative ribosome biogenesis GTPase RsgA 2 [Xylanibacillus composti]
MTNHYWLKNIGLTDAFLRESTRYSELTVGRVASQSKGLYKVITEQGEWVAEIAGKLRYAASSVAEYPVVGDFVMVDRPNHAADTAIIHHVLTRRTVLERKAAGTSQDVQIVASNMDIVFICMALNQDFNLRRLERYLAIAWNSGATPVVVLTKSDLCVDLQTKLDAAAAVALGVDLVVASSLYEDGIQAVQGYMGSGITCVFIGSSGVGKSTLINRLMGASVMETNATRKDDKGRHTTTRREMLQLPGGGVIVDTPGMRELGLEGAELSRSFADIDSLAAACKFADCRHENEPKCAVREAVQAGLLTEERLANYWKLKREAKYEGMNARQIESAKLDAMFGGVGGMKQARKFMKAKQDRKNR